jgi:hypothetical protein
MFFDIYEYFNCNYLLRFNQIIKLMPKIKVNNKKKIKPNRKIKTSCSIDWCFNSSISNFIKINKEMQRIITNKRTIRIFEGEF